MSSPGKDIQQAIYTVLATTAAITALVDGVYDTVPANGFGTKQAYITFGSSDMTPSDPDCIEQEEHSVQIDVWSRNVGKPAAYEICAAIKKALHLQSLPLTDNAFDECSLTLSQVMRDPDGLTIHGVMQFKVTIEVP